MGGDKVTNLIGYPIEEIENYLNERKGNALDINGWCVRDIETLNDKRSNLIMHISGVGKKTDGEAICPWCATEQSDSWEFEDGSHNCNFCEQSFMLTSEYTRTWHSKKTMSYKKISNIKIFKGWNMGNDDKFWRVLLTDSKEQTLQEYKVNSLQEAFKKLEHLPKKEELLWKE